MKANYFFRVIGSLPRALRRRRARGVLTREQFRDACLIVQVCVLVHCFLCASLWWARIHHGDTGSWSNWLGVAVAVAWVIFFWGFLLKQAYDVLETEVARENQQ
ncbi:hypothetical protein [Paraburkholderia phenoliruptrix]|uniref:hypothetical protein n=1 Tax=Paraburkholderia phenoliruptrix TaxID=252970 RepID=UPI0028698F46|nr:hypothetical protein [Paraburkholderia phenoliruptrix]WMY08259.1 hypothetical protein P3F88_00315 [Paraburkholderia phenoliruptrix]